MKLFDRVFDFDFMRYRRFWLGFSAATSALALVAMLTIGFKWAIDFTGGTLIEVGYERSVETNEIRTELENAGFENVTAQHFGTSKEVLLRFGQHLNPDASRQVVDALKQEDQMVEIRRVETVGPHVGKDLAEQGGLAMIFALLGILVYVMVRFEFKLALAAVVATLHDSILTAGLFLLTPWDFDLTVLAGLLTVIGYSINDTIVIFDRLRDNFRKMRTASVLDVANRSINQTMSRTIMTGTTTLLVLVGMLVLGGEMLRPFAAIVFAGVVIGTYSSIYVASPVAMALGLDRAALLPVVKEGASDDRP